MWLYLTLGVFFCGFKVRAAKLRFPCFVIKAFTASLILPRRTSATFSSAAAKANSSFLSPVYKHQSDFSEFGISCRISIHTSTGRDPICTVCGYSTCLNYLVVCVDCNVQSRNLSCYIILYIYIRTYCPYYIIAISFLFIFIPEFQNNWKWILQWKTS